MSSGRDIAVENAFLAKAEGRGMETPWIAAVLDRLAAHDEDFGQSYRWASLRDLLREVAEEGLDLGGWTSLVAESLDGRPELTDGQREKLRPLLSAIAKHGASAHELAVHAQRVAAHGSTA